MPYGMCYEWPSAAAAPCRTAGAMYWQYGAGSVVPAAGRPDSPARGRFRAREELALNLNSGYLGVMRLIDPPLEKLSVALSEMGEMAVQSITLATQSYLDGVNTSAQVHELSDQIRKRYYDVADLTFEMLLRYQPVADDFRLVRSSIEISYAYSRFGRYAYDIAQVRDEFGDISECRTEALCEISDKVKSMIKDAILSFSELDIRKAIVIQEDEKFVDRVYRERLPAIIKSTDTKCALAEALLLRYLERIADHALFMSDAVNYIVTGKHRPSDSQIRRPGN